MLAVLAVGLGIWACARWVGIAGFSAAWLALGTLSLMLLCNLRWPVFAKLRDIQLYGMAAAPPPTDWVKRCLGSNWFLILCCAGAMLWALGFAALLAGEDALAHFLWAALLVLELCAVLVFKAPPYSKPLRK